MKYQALSTKVSIVSVSRRAGLPHFGQATFRNAARLFERIARAVGDQVFGQHDRQVLLGHRHGAAGSSQWMIGIGVPQ